MPISPNTKGLIISKSSQSFDDTYNAIIEILGNNDKIKIVKELDHQANAKKVGLELDQTRLIIFGNPFLGTPLMIKNQVAALDLPQKILVYKSNEDVFVAYNSTGYLAIRHQIGDVPSLTTIEGALKNITNKATKADAFDSSTDEINLAEGVKSITSKSDFESTCSKVKSIIESNENLKLIADIDHSANATKASLSIRATRLFMFGNPKMGTPLMESSRTVAIDLPQKLLVWQDENDQVNISYNDPQYLVERHNIRFKDDIIEKISGALATISSKAAE